MSISPPLSSPPLTSVPFAELERGALDAHNRRAEADECAVRVWSRVGFVGDMTQIIRRMVNDVGTFSVSGNLNADCINGDSIVIGHKFLVGDENPTHAIYLNVGGLKFEPIGLGSEFKHSEDYATRRVPVLVSGTLTINCESVAAELAMEMSDVLHTALVATRHKWEREVGLHHFWIQGGSEMTRTEQEPNRRFTCVLEAVFRGSFECAMHTESLPLARIKVTVDPSDA